MTNVRVAGPIIAFHDDPETFATASANTSIEQLRQRESAERAAAKRSTSVAARRAHQELAQLLYQARRNGEAPRSGNGSESE
jgi:hypothetical protein